MRILRSTVLGWLGFLLMAALAGAQGPQPRVVIAWPSGLMEVRVGFDRAVDPEVARLVVGRSIEFGEGEKPGRVGRVGGDRGTLRVAAAKLVDDGRTLVLVTDPHPLESTYRLTFPGIKSPGSAALGSLAEVRYDLGGVEVVGTGAGGKWATWWPVVDAAEAQKLTEGSAEHDRIWSGTQKFDSLTLQTLVMAPRGDVTLDLDAPATFEAAFGSESAKAGAAGDRHRATLKTESTGEAIFLSLAFPAGSGVPTTLRASAGGRPLARSAFVLPWAPSAPPASPSATIPPQLLSGGDPARGAAVFASEQAKCVSCHQIQGKGGIVGPDLTSLAGRDRAWVYQNIIEPSASLHPNYVTHAVALKDGRIIVGVVRAEGPDAVKVSDIEARQSIIPRAEIDEIRPSGSSIMPVGLLGVIGDDNTRDLLAYLTAVK